MEADTRARARDERFLPSVLLLAVEFPKGKYRTLWWLEPWVKVLFKAFNSWKREQDRAGDRRTLL